MDDREQSVQHFLDLIKRSHRGKFKIYIGMIAGVGKSYRMLQEAHELLENGVDVQIGYVETHGRVGTEAMLQGLPVISRRKIFYKGKKLEDRYNYPYSSGNCHCGRVGTHECGGQSERKALAGCNGFAGRGNQCDFGN